MKNCPKCNAEIEDDFNICWKCNYSFAEGEIIEFKEVVPDAKEIDWLRCKIPMVFTGNYKFHEGFTAGAFGALFEILQNRESFDLYLCPKCGKVDFFSPTNKVK